MYSELLHLLRTLGNVAIALSGGLDSRFLVHAAQEAGCDILALTVAGSHITPADSKSAVEWAKARGIPHMLVPVDVLPVPDVAENNHKRCYGCKLLMFSRLLEEAEGVPLLEGTQADDIKVFRPGLRALKELGVRSPLAEVGMNKERIRELAAQTGLDRPDQTARPCLLTRLDYGLAPTPELLERISAAEADIAELCSAGRPPVYEFRIRLLHEGPPLLQLGREPDRALREELLNCMGIHGFDDAGIRVDPVVSGFFDRNRQ